MFYAAGEGSGEGLACPFPEKIIYYVPLGARPKIHRPQYNRVSVRVSFRVRVSVSVSIVYYAAGEGSGEGLALSPPSSLMRTTNLRSSRG